MKLITALLMSLLAALPDTVQVPQQMKPLEVTETLQQRVMRSTAPEYVLDAEELKQLGATDVSEALLHLPGITLRDYGGAGGMKTVSVRGFGTRHTGVCYDGLMLSDCQSGEIDLSRYTLDNVERIALIIGDNEDIFITARQASTPAHLNIETLAPPSADHLSHATAQVRAGSFGYVSPFVHYGQNFSDRLAFAVQGDFTHANNDYPFTLHNVTLTTRERRANSRMNSWHGEANMRWQIADRHQVSAKAYWYDNDRQLPGQVRYYTDLSRETLHEQNTFGQVHYLGHLGRGFALQGSGRFNWMYSDYRDPLYPGGVRDAQYWQREYYTTAALLYTPSEHWAFDYSVDYAFANLNSSLPTDRRPLRHTLLQSLTGKWHSHRLTIMGRLLYSLYLNDTQVGTDARDMSRLSPSFSASFRVLPAHDLYARVSYKNIFRAPTFNESYFFHYGSPDLLPETTDQVNVGLTWHHAYRKGSQLRLTTDAYLNHVRDKIVAIPVNMFIWRCINLGKVRVWGLDATASISQRLSAQHRILMTANYSLQHATNRTNPDSPYYGNQLAYTPLHAGGVNVCWENPWVDVSIQGEGSTSRYSTNEHYDGTRIDGYFEWGSTLSHAFHWGRHHLYASAIIKNIFDRQYEVVRLYPMPGRSYMFTLKYSL